MGTTPVMSLVGNPAPNRVVRFLSGQLYAVGDIPSAIFESHVGSPFSPHFFGMLKIHETAGDSGALSAVFLQVSNGALAIVSDDATFALPEGGLEAVMDRFGVPLDTASKVVLVATLVLGEGRALRHVRHLGAYDVIARDYVVYDAPGREPLCAFAVTVAGALDHLGRAAARRLDATTKPV